MKHWQTLSFEVVSKAVRFSKQLGKENQSKRLKWKTKRVCDLEGLVGWKGDGWMCWPSLQLFPLRFMYATTLSLQ